MRTVKDMENELAEATSDLAKSRTEVTELSGEIDDLKQALDNAEARIQELEDEQRSRREGSGMVYELRIRAEREILFNGAPVAEINHAAPNFLRHRFTDLIGNIGRAPEGKDGLGPGDVEVFMP